MDSQYSTSQNHKRSVDYTYDESKELLEPSAHTHRQLSSSYSGSQSHPLVDGQFFDTSFPLSQIPQVYGSTPDLTMSQYASSMWNRHGHVQQSTSFSPNFPNSNDYNFEPSTTYTTQGTTDGMFGRGMEFGGIPRTWNGYNSALAQTTTMSGFELSQSNMLTETSGHTEGMESNNVSRESTCDFQPQRMAHSPKFFTENPSMHNDHGGHDALTFNTPTSVRMGSCEVIDDTEGLTSGELTSTEVDDMTADEPYAKLIYRALMSTPNHSMVLQEIYQWFRENTNKGSSDSKGWMNSIRHNLSMNGAFKKSERKHSTDETKKSTEWVLDDQAIREGCVQSTTRFRKGAGGRKHSRNESPAPPRQRSGQKGLISTRSTGGRGRRNVELRNRGSSHGVPQLETSIMGFGTGGHARGRFGHLDHDVETPQPSPLTPPMAEGPSALYYGYVTKAAAPDFGTAFEDGLCGLEHVQGVCLDDEPVFAEGSGGRQARQHDLGVFGGYSVSSGRENQY